MELLEEMKIKTQRAKIPVGEKSKRTGPNEGFLQRTFTKFSAAWRAKQESL